jgi:hypothetical protein
MDFANILKAETVQKAGNGNNQWQKNYGAGAIYDAPHTAPNRRASYSGKIAEGINAAMGRGKDKWHGKTGVASHTVEAPRLARGAETKAHIEHAHKYLTAAGFEKVGTKTTGTSITHTYRHKNGASATIDHEDQSHPGTAGGVLIEVAQNKKFVEKEEDMTSFAQILKNEAVVQKIGNGNNQYSKGNAAGTSSHYDEHTKNLPVGHSAHFAQLDHKGQEAGENIQIMNQGDRHYGQAGGQDKGGTHAEVKAWATALAAEKGAKLHHVENTDASGETVKPHTGGLTHAKNVTESVANALRKHNDGSLVYTEHFDKNEGNFKKGSGQTGTMTTDANHAKMV